MVKKGRIEMVFGKFVTDEKDMKEVQKICNRVFGEEMGLDLSGTMTDEFCMNALVYAGENPAGMGRIMFDGERFTIAEVAVLPEYRNEKYGDFLVRLLVDKAMMSNAREVHLDAFHGTEGFFETIGFEQDGALFEGFGGMWQPMILRTDRIHKCCNCGH